MIWIGCVFLLTLLFHVKWTKADYISFGVGQSVCRQHQDFGSSGNVVPPAKQPPGDIENQCLWYQMDKNCIKGSESDCVLAKTCAELGISGAKAGRSSGGASSAAIYRVSAQDENGVVALMSLEEKFRVDFLSSPKVNGFADVIVMNREAPQIIDVFKSNGIEYKVTVPDVQKYSDEERKLRTERRKKQLRKGGKGEISWDEFYNLTEIYDWLDKLTTDHSDLATLQVIGQTYEERDLKFVKICKGGCGQKPGVIIEAGVHAREWAGVTTATYIINELVTTPDKYSEILDKLDIYIIPIFNPDGYEYSFVKYRLFRKNRAPTEGAEECKEDDGETGGGTGVDLNRNWGYKWEAGNDSCYATFPGLAGFSEKETSAFRDFVLEQQKSGVKFTAYINFHTWGQEWMFPWSWSTEEKPEDVEELRKLAEDSVAALTSVHGTNYTVGSVSEIQRKPLKGNSVDWFKAGEGAGIKWAYSLELRSSETGFELPPEEILPNAEEVWIGVQVSLKFFAEEK